MPENDQVKWRGIRPVNPPENIPVTESTPLTQIDVAPLAGCNDFPVVTQKKSPAIADLQAPESFVRVFDTDLNVGAPNYMQDSYTVPAGKIFRLEYLMAMCAQPDPTLIEFAVRSGATNYRYYEADYGVAWERHDWTHPMLYDEGEIVRVIWTATLAGTDCYVTIIGHVIDKY